MVAVSLRVSVPLSLRHQKVTDRMRKLFQKILTSIRTEEELKRMLPFLDQSNVYKEKWYIGT